LKSSNANYIPTLDGWRAIAILCVLFDHTVFRTFHPYGWTLVGGHGVEIFFVLSGYLITGKLLEDGSLRKFYTRRAFRILPVLFVYLAAAGFLGFLLHRIPLQRSEIASSLLFVRNFFLYPSATWNGVGWFTAHLWSLSIEEQFYLLWPLVLLKLGRRTPQRQGLAALSLFAFWTMIFILVHLGRWLHLGGWHWMPHLNYTGLVVGCMLRIAFSHTPTATIIGRFFLRRSTAVVLFALAYFVVFHNRVTWLDPFICAAALCSTLVEPGGLMGRVLELATLRWIGRLSYSLYVWQQIFLGFGVVFRPFGILSIFPVNLCVLFAVACLSYYGMEKPLMRLGHKLTRERTTLPTPGDHKVFAEEGLVA
jgi:peptidoglycan/LPS O-acetylase OafA/YrhL